MTVVSGLSEPSGVREMAQPALPPPFQPNALGPVVSPQATPADVGRVVLPFVAGMLRDETLAAISLNGVVPELAYLSKGDPAAYAQLIHGLWADGEGFTIVEQDMVPPAGSLAALARCGHRWCVHPYSVGKAPTSPMLGLARFSTDLVQSRPGLAHRALYRGSRRGGWTKYRGVDMAMATALQRAGIVHHDHFPAAGHLHEYANPDDPGT